MQNYCEIEGQISVSQIERSDGRDRELYSVAFSIGDVEFDTANAYAPEEKIWFVEGQEMYVEYGFIGQQLMIYKIYAIDGYTGGSGRRKGWLSKNGTVALTVRTGCSQRPEYSFLLIAQTKYL